MTVYKLKFDVHDHISYFLMKMKSYKPTKGKRKKYFTTLVKSVMNSTLLWSYSSNLLLSSLYYYHLKIYLLNFIAKLIGAEKN